MKNLVRGGIILMISSLFVVLIYAQTRSEETLIIANDSQPKLNNTQTSNISNQDNQEDKNKKLVKTTGLVTSAKAAGMNKGSFSATAYCLQGRTATGRGVRRGIIAADPRVLRLGSKVMITGGGYTGQYLVSDTGGNIKGRKLDIWVPSCSEARRFGRHSVNVILLPN